MEDLHLAAYSWDTCFLGPTQCRNLPFFHLLPGCNSTTVFLGFGKVRVWKAMEDFCNGFTKFFAKLSFCISIKELTENDIQMMKQFISLLYLGLKSFTTLEINKARKMLPPKSERLQKFPSSIFQCIIWTNSIVRLPNTPPVQNFGWKLIDGTFSFLWSTLLNVITGKVIGICSWNATVKSPNWKPCKTLCGCKCCN